MQKALKSILLIKPFLIFCCLFFCLSCNNNQSKKNTNSEIAHEAVAPIPLPPPPEPIDKKETEKYSNACKAWYDTMLAARGFSGGMLVAKKGNIVFEQYSSNSIDSIPPVFANTPLHLASVSKTFTAMAVVYFWQQRKFSLDDELSKFLPSFNYPGVTIRTLLNHRSGLPNYVYFFELMGWNQAKYASNQDVFDWLVNKKAEMKDLQPPNTHFSYCNTNYALLALFLEKISGKKYADLLQHIFFKPLQMNNTFVYDTSMINKVAVSYDWRGRKIDFNFLDAVYGDKNIYSTPQDIFIWDRALINIFTDSTLQEVYAPYSNEKPGVRNYGLGWRMNVYPNGKKLIYHNGWWHGNNATFIRMLDEEATIIIIGNKFTRAVYYAKSLTSLFGDYGYSTEGEDENITEPTEVKSKKILPKPSKDSLQNEKKMMDDIRRKW